MLPVHSAADAEKQVLRMGLHVFTLETVAELLQGVRFW